MHERIGRAFPEAEIEEVLVQPMVTGGREMIVGGRRDVGEGAGVGRVSGRLRPVHACEIRADAATGELVGRKRDRAEQGLAQGSKF